MILGSRSGSVNAVNVPVSFTDDNTLDKVDANLGLSVVLCTGTLRSQGPGNFGFLLFPPAQASCW